MMDKNSCLITGCGGFIGSYLARFLLEKGVTVYGTVHRLTKNIEPLRDKMVVLEYDVLDRRRAEEIMSQVKPDYVFHLAAQSLVSSSWQDPEKTITTNILGTLYLLDSIIRSNIDPLVEVVCSSAEYGFCNETEAPVREDRELKPSSPYGVSKLGQDMLAYLYWRTYGMKIIRLRPFYVTGPGKTLDSCSDFARSIVEIERGQREVLSVGNLEAIRDIVDVRDCVEAIYLLATKGIPGEVYNICSGRGYKIADILGMLLSLSANKVLVSPSAERMRPSDDPILVGDNSKLSKLGWKPQTPIERTLSDILDYWRKELALCSRS